MNVKKKKKHRVRETFGILLHVGMKMVNIKEVLFMIQLLCMMKL